MCRKRCDTRPGADDNFRGDVVEIIPSLRCYARSLTRNMVDADDLVQETLLRAIIHIESFRTGTNLRAWLFTIMRNRFYTNIRKSAREPVGSDDCVSGALSSPPPQDAQMELRDVKRALLNLPHPYRATIAFVVLREKTYSSAADHFGCDIGTIKSRINRARRMMRNALE